MKGKKAMMDAEYILLMAGVVIIVIGAIIFIWGFNSGSSNRISTGAVTALVGIALLAIAKKLF